MIKVYMINTALPFLILTQFFHPGVCMLPRRSASKNADHIKEILEPKVNHLVISSIDVFGILIDQYLLNYENQPN